MQLILQLSLFLFPADEMSEMFDKKEIVKEEGPVTKRKSALSLQLEESSNVARNPFVEYARFSGRVCKTACF